MGEEFYCVLKLVSGEEIFSLISVDETGDNPLIILQNPVIMNMVSTPTGSIIKVKPWMELTHDEVFIIHLDKVITMTESKDKKMIELYNYYLSDDSTDVYVPGGKVNVSQEMGYISSVEESRKRLEKLYKKTKES